MEKFIGIRGAKILFNNIAKANFAMASFTTG